MAESSTRRLPGSGERGLITVQFVAATAFSLVLLVLVANLLVDLYARGAVREALDEGTRVASRSGGTAAMCEERAAEVLDGLLRGPVGEGIGVECRVGGGWVHAAADVRLRAWLPGIAPDWRFQVHAVALQERL